MRRVIPLGALTLAVLAAVLAPGPASAAVPLPSCTYGDVMAPDHAPADWQRTLVDTTYRLPSSYVPPDLVPVTRAGLTGNGSVRALVIDDLRALARSAAAAGAPLSVESAYRSYATQILTFNRWVSVSGRGAALLGTARPGHSEHQLGVTIDFRSAGGPAPWSHDWATTPAGAWMLANAWRFGFVMSYPKNASPAKTCYDYEAWHYRYVGRDQAAAIHASGMSLREFLWAQHNGAGGTAAPAGSGAAAQLPRITAPSAVEQAAGAQITSGTAAAPTASSAAADLDVGSVAPPTLTLLVAAILLIIFPVGELGEWRPRSRRRHPRRSMRQASLYPG
jgi:D-alanyl-D-alanine carboxypeptidase